MARSGSSRRRPALQLHREIARSSSLAAPAEADLWRIDASITELATARDRTAAAIGRICDATQATSGAVGSIDEVAERLAVDADAMAGRAAAVTAEVESVAAISADNERAAGAVMDAAGAIDRQVRATAAAAANLVAITAELDASLAVFHLSDEAAEAAASALTTGQAGTAAATTVASIRLRVA